MQYDAAHQLNPIGPETKHSVGGLADGGKGLRKQLVQGFPVLITLLELVGFGL
ncbi:hypothetical protein SDC9_154024 [bioreactor metagenome]|uniref:Uncharacterized protein n=1 Tax=bioreactor metagenome TaxID=1076179 RepID=A0A645EXX7_9ZZZZ